MAAKTNCSGRRTRDDSDTDDDIDQLFEQLDLSEVKYQGEPEVEVALVASMSNTIATVRKYQPIEPRPEGIGKQSAGVAREKVIKWTDQTQKVNGLYTKHSYPAYGNPAISLLQSTLTTRQLLARKDAAGAVVYDGFRMYDKVWCSDQPTEQSNQFCDNITMWPALIIGLWTSNTLKASGNVEETVYKILYFATCSCAHSNSTTMVEWFAGCAKGLGAVNNCLVRNAYSSANQRNAEQSLLIQWRESTKSWNIDQGPPAALLKTHCDAEDSSMDQDVLMK